MARRPGPGLGEVYRRLRARFGPAGWWPARTPFEVCVGAVLVQGTAWRNAERALAALREEGLLSFAGLRRVPLPRLERLIRSSGFFRVKARRLRAFLAFLGSRCGGRARALAGEEPLALRRALLEVPGVGRETADSIVLYAAGLPLFVVDAYTRRVFSRLGFVRGDEPYDELQRQVMEGLPKRATLYNDFHAQIVRLAKDFCRPSPTCDDCPLDPLCPRVGVKRRSPRATLASGDGGAPASTGS